MSASFFDDKILPGRDRFKKGAGDSRLMALDQLPWGLLRPFFGASRDAARGYPLSMGSGPWAMGL